MCTPRDLLLEKIQLGLLNPIDRGLCFAPWNRSLLVLLVESGAGSRPCQLKWQKGLVGAAPASATTSELLRRVPV